MNVIYFLCVLVMAKSHVKSCEAKVNFDEDVLEGKQTKFPNNLTRSEIVVYSVYTEECAYN